MELEHMKRTGRNINKQIEYVIGKNEHEEKYMGNNKLT